jgi:hypothetical protein
VLGFKGDGSLRFWLFSELKAGLKNLCQRHVQIVRRTVDHHGKAKPNFKFEISDFRDGENPSRISWLEIQWI